MPLSIKTPLGSQSKLHHQRLRSRESHFPVADRVARRHEEYVNLRHPENLSCVWIFHSGPGGKIADIDVVSLR